MWAFRTACAELLLELRRQVAGHHDRRDRVGRRFLQDARLRGELRARRVQVLPDQAVHGRGIHDPLRDGLDRLVVRLGENDLLEERLRRLVHPRQHVGRHQLAGVGERVGEGEALAPQLGEGCDGALLGDDDVGVVDRRAVGLGRGQQLEAELRVAVDVGTAADECRLELAVLEHLVDFGVALAVHVLDLRADLLLDVAEEVAVVAHALLRGDHAADREPHGFHVRMRRLGRRRGGSRGDFLRLLPLAPGRPERQHGDQQRTHDV